MIKTVVNKVVTEVKEAIKETVAKNDKAVKVIAGVVLVVTHLLFFCLGASLSKGTSKVYVVR